MGRKVLCLCLTLGLSQGAPLSGQTAADPEVAKGIKEVEEGDYDAGIFTLDAASRRLAKDPARARDLSQAYLYLGIAYLGKGHETSAKARFLEALAQARDMKLSPDQFSPKVIELFEAAKEDLTKTASAASPPPSPSPQPKSGSKVPLIVLGVGGAAAAGVAVAAGGGGSSGTPTTTTLGPRVLNEGPSVLTLGQRLKEFDVTPSGPGTLTAQLGWSEASANLVLYLQDATTLELLASSGAFAATSRSISSAVTARRYKVGIKHCVPGECSPVSTSDATITLRVTYP